MQVDTALRQSVASEPSEVSPTSPGSILVSPPQGGPLPAAAGAPTFWKTKEYKRQKQQAWRAANPDKSVAYVMRAYHRRRATPTGWLAYVIAEAHRRAAKKGMVSDITVADLEMPTHCAVLGIRLWYGAPKNEPSAASLDRIDPTKGYEKGNVRIISLRANRLRSNCTDPAVFFALALDAERLRRG